MIGKSQRKTDFRKMLKSKKPNMLINITGLRFDVEVNSEVYSEEDCDRLSEIINHMAKDIWIDRTYVNYSGNRFKDSFIREDAWYDFIHLCVSSDFGRKNKKKHNAIMEAIIAISTAYILGIVKKFGYNLEDVNFELTEDSKFNVSYFVDNRKNWNY